MQLNNPMTLANLLNSEPQEFNWETNTSSFCRDRASSTIPSPPPSDCSPRPMHRRITLPSLFRRTDRLPYSPPPEMRGLAIRPRLGDNQYFSPPSSQQYPEPMQIHLPFIQYREWEDSSPVVRRASLDIELNYQTSSRRALERSPSARHRQRARNSRLLMPSRREIEAMSNMTSPIGSPQFNDNNTQQASAIVSKPRPAHSNAKYSNEQVDYFRYQKEDLELKWGEILILFSLKFPEEGRESDQCLTSRFYRDNIVPMVTPDWQLIYDDNGRVKMQPAKVRERSSEKNREAPYTFIEKHPGRAVNYDWVRPADKMRAWDIIEKDKREAAAGCLSEAGKWRRAIQEAEERKGRK